MLLDRPEQYLLCLAVPALVLGVGLVLAAYDKYRPALACIVAALSGGGFAIHQLRGFDLASDAQAGIALVMIAFYSAAISIGVGACTIALLPARQRK